MKIGLLGDIHGNALALEAVLQSAFAASVEKLVVTGDLVGYYFAPFRVLQLLSEWDRSVVRGNHEEMLCSSRNDPAFLATVDVRYGSGIRVAMEQLSEDQINELCALPHPLELTLDGVRVLLCHGAPWDLNQYLYPDTDVGLIERCAGVQHDLVVVGHTHYPMLKVIGKTLLVNPGSVGQPRNRQLGAQWVLFDTSTRSVEFRREEYDPSSLIAECRSRHPELPYLSEVLVRV